MQQCLTMLIIPKDVIKNEVLMYHWMYYKNDFNSLKFNMFFRYYNIYFKTTNKLQVTLIS